jgi:hypothetical protein
MSQKIRAVATRATVLAACILCALPAAAMCPTFDTNPVPTADVVQIGNAFLVGSVVGGFVMLTAAGSRLFKAIRRKRRGEAKQVGEYSEVVWRVLVGGGLIAIPIASRLIEPVYY